MKRITNQDKAQIKAAMQDVVDRTVDLWNAEGDLEGVIGLDVDGIGEYFKDYAATDAVINDEDIDTFLDWAMEHAEPEAF